MADYKENRIGICKKQKKLPKFTVMKHLVLGAVAGLVLAGALTFSNFPDSRTNDSDNTLIPDIAVASNLGVKKPLEMVMQETPTDISLLPPQPANLPEIAPLEGDPESHLIAKRLPPAPPAPGGYPVSKEPTHPYHIIVNLNANRLRVYKDDEIIKVFPVCVGHPAHPTPTISKASIKQIIWNPSWGPPPDSAWASKSSARRPGKMNPMGVVKMPLRGMIFVHGTYKLKSLGFAWSHGCIRMANEDAVELAWFIQNTIGCSHPVKSIDVYSGSRSTRVVKLNQPVPAKTIYETVEIKDGKLFIHPDYYRRKVTNEGKVMSVIKKAGLDTSKIDKRRIRQMIQRSRKETALMPVSELMTTGTTTVSSVGNDGG